MMNAKYFIDNLCALDFEHVFNPYSDRCEIFDRENASAIRRSTLLAILSSAVELDIDSIWVGRDLGHRGGRRTGLALTDEAHMQAHAERWGLSVDRPTHGELVVERTAAVIWEMLSKIERSVFLWNVFPLHPHSPGNPFSNRPHKAFERCVGEELLQLLVELIKPKRIIAVGNDAEKAANRVASGVKVVKVRHPSYGGQNKFTAAVSDLYSLV